MISGICLDPPDTADPSCPGSSLSNVSGTETGTLMFAAGGTYTTNVGSTLTYTETTPQSCLAPSTCADLPIVTRSSAVRHLHGNDCLRLHGRHRRERRRSRNLRDLGRDVTGTPITVVPTPWPIVSRGTRCTS